jgi:hypothetical protein
MKRIINMNNDKRSNRAFVRFVWFVVISLFICSCEHPFKAGLGPAVDLQAPTIVLEAPGAGSYIRGVTEFSGRAFDDTKLESVWFQLVNYPDVTLPGYRTMTHNTGRFHKMTDITGSDLKWNWKFRIDTTRFPDGDFMIRLRVVDSATKEAVTDEIAFYVKNDIPQISLSFPLVVQGTRDGELGGEHLNYNFFNNQSGVFQRVMDTRGLMVGMISDSEGLYRGRENAEEGLFPPQIRFWRVDITDDSEVSDDTGAYPLYPPGVLPPVKVNEGGEGVAWVDLDIMEIGINNLQFTYPLPNVSGRYFGFEIRAQSSDKDHSAAEYPRSWNTIQDEENQYVLIYLRTPSEYPTLELYKLEDIYGPNGWDADRYRYRDIDTITEQDKKDGNYPYITKTISSKGGSFTLRMKAYHSGGIASAKVYWEKEDKSEKGRFIWDPVNTPPYPGWKGSIVSDSGKRPYETWGRNDPNVSGGMDTIKSFVFTYNDDADKDKVPNTTDFYEAIRGRSRIQVYRGPNVIEGRVLDFDDLPEAMENWEDKYSLDEGTYNLSVYASSTSNTRIAVPFTATVSIDKQEPELSLNYIEGGAGEYYSVDLERTVHIVNGVVRPRLLLSDSRPVDTGFRTATSDYFLRADTGRMGYEQAFIVIPAGQKQAMDDYLQDKSWPDFPDHYALGDPPRIPGVTTVSKHGPIVDSGCLFKTSKIYGNAVTETDTLADGLYWLYAFGRDDAFNTGTVSFPIEVRRSSDDPEFDFSVGSVSVDVDQPDAAYDYPASDKLPASERGKGFITADGMRNKFTANSAIRVRIKDDDSLDLGVHGEAESNISVTFIGSKPEAGKTVVHDDSYLMELSDEEIKNVFTPQTTYVDDKTGLTLRRPVKEITGSISQKMLLDMLKSKKEYNGLFGADKDESVKPIPDISVKHGFNSLPDGIYRVGIIIRDYSPAKLIMDTDPLPADVITKEEYFWIAVDSKNPEVPAKDTVISPASGSFIPSDKQVNLEGVVSDANGPIIVTGWTVSDGINPLSGDGAPTLEITQMILRPFDSDGLWKYDFSFPMDMKNYNGTFVFEIRFEDRFGNSSTLTLRYSVDREPPNVILTKLIETFERDMPDVDIGGYIQLDDSEEGVKRNKERLAVKVISFSLSANDNFKVEGIHWWLLPADTSSNASGFTTADAGGQVLDYNAFPSQEAGFDHSGVYYSKGSYTPGFDKGAYGVTDPANMNSTITVNTERMLPENGEYRLHIIAIDGAGNISRLTQDVNKNPTSNVFQTVFFLQEEDKPYFYNISPSSGGALGDAPGGADVIGETDLIVRGTMYENNGFSAGADNNDALWEKTIQVWFANDKNTAVTDLDVLRHILEDKDNLSPSLTGQGYTGPVTIEAGLGMSGRNLSMAFGLKDYFPDGISGDGVKYYIIKATDSPVNKIKEDGTPADADARVSRWNLFSFTYDNVPPKIELTEPEQGLSFGENFVNDFNLAGYIEDANLKTMTDYNKSLPTGHADKDKPDPSYYFEYYLDDAITRKPFALDSAHIIGTSEPSVGVTRVDFKIEADGTLAKVISKAEFDALSDGPHTLILVVGDKSGKEASFMYNFIKDTTPPEITFTNTTFREDSKIYDKDNKSRIYDKDSRVPTDDWWAVTDPEIMRVWLLANPISTIYYDTGKPILTGTFADAVSDIDVPVGNVNDSSSSFKYWIDGSPDGTAARYEAVIDGSGRNVRWSIYLTGTGLESGKALSDGVHTIMIEVGDKSGIVNDGHYMIAFRIDSKQPAAAITPPANAVFGSAAYQADPVFTIKGTAGDANLADLELRVMDKTTPVKEIKFSNPGASNDGLNVTQTWTYNPGAPAVDDDVQLAWTYSVTNALFDSLTNGKSYDVIAVAVDSAGNRSEESLWTFIKDTSKPKIIFTNLNTNSEDLKPADFIEVSKLTVDNARVDSEKNNINRLSSENLRIDGRVTDDYSAVRQLQSQIEKWNWDTEGWDIKEAWKDVRDLKENKFNEVNWTKNLLGQEGGFNIGAEGSPEGLYRVQLRAKDESYTENGTNQNYLDPDWLASDRGNPAESEYVYFYYDRAIPELTVNGDMDNIYSTKLIGGRFEFSGTARDNNRFAKIEVRIEPVDKDKFPTTTPYSADRTIDLGDLNVQPSAAKIWDVEFTGVHDNSDGRYRVVATVYDMTGNRYSVTRAFTLDNTPPGAKFTAPSKEARSKYMGNGDDSENKEFASVIVNGGEGAVIQGETWDKSDNNSESGIDKMWFRLGFLDNDAATPPAFPTRADIKADADRLIAIARGSSYMNNAGAAVKDINNLMDYVSEHKLDDDLGNAWFRLGGTTAPTGFVINSANIHDWRMEIPNKLDPSHPDFAALRPTDHNPLEPLQIGGLKLYGDDIKIKGRDYKVVRGIVEDNYRLQMARSVSVPGQAGIYRLPLWIRLVDKVGNVEYYCHDIFFYPDGDIPTTSIENPDNGVKDKARGGSISVDGIARSNTSVYDVIFRVFADNVTNTDLDGSKTIGSLPSADSVVRIPNYDFVPVGSDTYKKIPAAYQTTNGISATAENSNWYSANLMLKGGAGEPQIPWSVMLNAEQEITKLIASRGFYAYTGSTEPAGSRDTIRVWMEVFVFNGEDAPIRSSVYQDDGANTAGGALYGTAKTDGGAPGPKPYVRAFYVKLAAPQITHPNVGDWNSGSLVFNPENTAFFDSGSVGYKGAGTEVRRARFAVKAVLDPNPTGSGSGLGLVSIRTRRDNGAYSGWTKVWEAGALLPNSYGVKISPNTVTVSPNRTRYNFEYDIDSTASKSDANAAGFADLNNGAWANTGGTLTVQILIRDSVMNEADQSIVVGVDNFAPLTDPYYRTNSKVAGTSVDFMARVYDYATPPSTDIMTSNAPRKIAKVYAWFTKGTRFVNMKTGDTVGSLSSPRTMSALENRTADVEKEADNETIKTITVTGRGTPRTITYPSILSGEKAHDAAWVRELSETTAQPGTRMLWAPMNSAVYDIRWSFNIDTTILPDGALRLNYLVVDEAGNASYFTQDYSVRNRYPHIERVTLYTDNNGQGAAYTQDASAEYIVNDYRGRMFANYTDLTDKDRSDSTGYINSGFISNNRYIGFEVETLSGNRDLNFRLQHVRRERVVLTRDNLIEMVADREKPDKINLYTIAWHGGFSSAGWKSLGAPVDNPTLGTHFVLQMTEVPADYADNTAEVWRYTPVVTSGGDFTPANQGADEAIVVQQDKFRFTGAAHFDTSRPADRIGEFNGSYPDPGDEDKNKLDKTALFLIRVWDTVSGRGEYTSYEKWVNDQLYDALVVGMNVYLTDTVRPTVRLYDLNPYTEISVVNNNITDANKAATIRNAADPIEVGANIARGGLFNTKTQSELVKSGYIDPRNNTYALNPKNSNGAFVDYPNKIAADSNVLTVGSNPERDKVSGRVILRGIAYDDQLIDEIWVRINAPGGTAQKRILRLVNGVLAADNAATLAYAVEDLHWKRGHTVEWAYVWDTETEPAGRPGGGPRTEVQIQVFVKDKNGSLHSHTGTTVSTGGSYTDITEDNNNNVFHNQATVDIVPYLIGFERQTSKYATKRSLQGWYSFYQNEPYIVLLGYNFGQNANNVTVNLLSANSGSGLNIPTAYLTSVLLPASLRNHFSFTMPAAAASGRLNVRVGSPAVDVYNHTSVHTNKSWNREYHPYTSGSDLWINKPHAHIWRSYDDYNDSPTSTPVVFSGSMDVEHPAMALEYRTGGNPGRLHGIWKRRNDRTFYAYTRGIGSQLVSTNVFFPDRADISIYNGGGADAANIGGIEGESYFVARASVNGPVNDHNIYGYAIANYTDGFFSGRFSNIRISKAAANFDTSEDGMTGINGGNVGRAYMTAYDSKYQGLWYGTRGGTSSTNHTSLALSMDGRRDPEMTEIRADGLARTTSAGQYSAIGYDNIGPIIVYYDNTNDTVRVALGTSTSSFTRYYLLPTTNPLRKGSGKYISMKVDAYQGIHIAFYNSVHNTVVYYYAANRNLIVNGTPNAGINVKVHTVDKVMTSGGMWTDISVDNYTNPYIVYGDTSRIGSTDGARMAYRSYATTTPNNSIAFTGTLKCPVTGYDITGWEAVTMPSDYTVNNDRLNIEAWPPTPSGNVTVGTRPTADTWNAAIGYGSDIFRIGYFFWPAYKSYTN